MAEEIQISLEDLLSLALGTPEVGAVNFNYLNEVISELIKHIGIAKKLTTSKIRLSGRFKPVESAFEVPQMTYLTRPQDDATQTDVQGNLSNKDSKDSSSKVQKKFSSLPPLKSHSDVSAASRKAEDRQDSKGTTSDAWHVLNINRRLEAAEATIQGIKHLIDNTNIEFEDLKNSMKPESFKTSSRTLLAMPRTKSINCEPMNQQEDDMIWKLTAKVNDHEDRINSLEKSTCNAATQNHNYCTPDQVNDLIMEKLSNLQSLDIDDSVDETAPVPVSDAKDNATTISCQTLDVKHNSGSKLWHIEMSAKLSNFDKEMQKYKNRVEHLETELQQNPEQESPPIETSTNDMTVCKQLQEDLANVNNKLTAFGANQTDLKEEVLQMKQKMDVSNVDYKTIFNSLNKLERDLEHVADNFHRTQSDVMKTQPQRKHSSSIDETQLNKIRGTIFDLQEQQSKFQNEVDALTQDNTKKDSKIKDIYAIINDLQENKVDEDFVLKKFSDTVGIDAIKEKLDRQQFDACINDIDRNIQEVMERINVVEHISNRGLSALRDDLVEKVDRHETKDLKIYIDKRFKSFKPKMAVTTATEENNAAATRKQLTHGCHCISCDRPVHIENYAGIPIPNHEPFPGIKSMRPLTTFDMQSIRQQMQTALVPGNKDRFEMSCTRDKIQKELLQLCGARNHDDLAYQTSRACGGVHTLIEQHRRNPGKPTMLFREEQQTLYRINGIDGEIIETDIMGLDGHIYKGRAHSPNRLPVLVKKSKQDSTENAPMIPRPSIQRSRSGLNAAEQQLQQVK